MSNEDQSLFYIQEASRLLLSGQPFQAHDLLTRNGLRDSDLGLAIERTLPDYERAMPMLAEFQRYLLTEPARAQEISKTMPELIYPESLQMQRLAVAVLEEDSEMIHDLLEQLPSKHPFRVQIESLLAPPDEKRKKVSNLLPIAATLLLSIGATYWIYQEGQQDMKTMTFRVDQAQAAGEASTLEIARLEKELEDKENLIQSLESKHEQEIATLIAENEEAENDDELAGFTAYSEGRYQEAIELLNQMEPVGLYNQETIDFYKLMAQYKVDTQSRDVLNEFEATYPTSDYLGDAYFSYYIASVKRNGSSSQLATEIKSRFSSHWFIDAL